MGDVDLGPTVLLLPKSPVAGPKRPIAGQDRPQQRVRNAVFGAAIRNALTVVTLALFFGEQRQLSLHCLRRHLFDGRVVDVNSDTDGVNLLPARDECRDGDIR
jgi:hypothetical protein